MVQKIGTEGEIKSDREIRRLRGRGRERKVEEKGAVKITLNFALPA